MSKLNFDDEIISDNEEIIQDITPLTPRKLLCILATGQLKPFLVK